MLKYLVYIVGTVHQATDGVREEVIRNSVIVGESLLYGCCRQLPAFKPGVSDQGPNQNT
jgi:hypothetical protein